MRALLVLALLTSTARAQTVGEDMQQYFRGEKRGGLWLMGMGTVSLAGGGGLLVEGSEAAEGAAYPLLGLGAIELVFGAVVYFRTDPQVRRLDRALATDAAGTIDRELRRMRNVNLSFRIVKIVELVAFAWGLGAATYGLVEGDDWWVGHGAAFVGQSVALYVFDTFAHARGERYQSSLERFQVGATVGGGVGISVGGTF